MPQQEMTFYRTCFFFFKILFIYLTERQAAREGTQEVGVGEEEAGSQWRSLMWGSIPECQDHALSLRQMLNDCATQAPQQNMFLT